MRKGVILCIAMLAGFAAAATTYVGEEGAVCYANLGERAWWVGAAFLLTLALIALAYMFGHATENERVSVWAHDEIFSLGVAVLVVAGMAAFTIGSCTVLSAYSNQQGVAGEKYASPSPFATSYRYLDDLANSGLKTVEAQTKQGLQRQLEATRYFYFGWPARDAKGVALLANRKALAAHKELAIDIMLPMVVSLRVQRGALQVIEIIGLAVMLPFAIILRIVPFTRSAGNLMLAVVFCLYVVVPAVYVLSAGAWNDVEDGATLASDPPVFSFKDRGLGDACSERDCPLYGISALMPQAIFLPNLVIVVFVTAAMALSRALNALPV